MTSPDSYLQADRLAQANPELTAEDIRKMPMSDWARLTGRTTRLIAAPVTVTPIPSPPGPESAPGAGMEPLTANPKSVKEMSREEYAAYRKQIGMGQSTNVGIFGTR